MVYKASLPLTSVAIWPALANEIAEAVYTTSEQEPQEPLIILSQAFPLPWEGHEPDGRYALNLALEQKGHMRKEQNCGWPIVNKVKK